MCTVLNEIEVKGLHTEIIFVCFDSLGTGDAFKTEFIGVITSLDNGVSPIRH